MGCVNRRTKPCDVKEQRDRLFSIRLHAEIALKALNNKPKRIMLFPAQMKGVKLVKMFETRNVVLNGAKAATQISEISNEMGDHENFQRK